MAIYEYRCERDGAFDVMLPIGTAPASIACPVCASEAGRVFSSPMLSLAPRALVAALDHEEKTRHEPDVVTSLPPRPRHERTPVLPLTPTLRRLPRP
ncbi:MAG TPA: FmdB family zinc ribbon protein [Solirubrobacteraceae bacterium]|nr:FmdB family zinc ribbon protein [Solirubrobacteraceae bacterium]